MLITSNYWPVNICYPYCSFPILYCHQDIVPKWNSSHVIPLGHFFPSTTCPKAGNWSARQVPCPLLPQPWGSILTHGDPYAGFLFLDSYTELHRWPLSQQLQWSIPSPSSFYQKNSTWGSRSFSSTFNLLGISSHLMAWNIIYRSLAPKFMCTT